MRSGGVSTGVILAITAAILWGLSGTFGQFLFHERGFTPEWLIAVRLLVSGVLLITFATARGYPVFKVWRDPKDAVRLILFSVLGMLAVQYTFALAIQHSNAPTATILQYTAPVMIAIFLTVSLRKWPSRKVVITIALTVLGTFLFVTAGDITALNAAPLGVLWGLLSAAALAFYSLQPGELLQRHRSAVVVAWAMLIGGVLLTPFGKPWVITGTWDALTWLALFVIIILGSFVAYTIYLSSIKTIGAQVASLLASAEPLAATFFTVLWLKTPFGIVEAIGGACIVGAVTLLTVQRRPVE